MTSLLLKIIACVCMLLDHVGYVFGGELMWLRIIGRVAFPIFAFQLAVGYDKTRNLPRMLLRVGLFAIAAQIPFYLMNNPDVLLTFSFSNLGQFLVSCYTSRLNVMFTLFCGLLCMLICDRVGSSPMPRAKSQLGQQLYHLLYIAIGIILCLPLALIADKYLTDYGLWGVLLTMGFYVARKNKWLTALVLVLFTFSHASELASAHSFYFYAVCLGHLMALVPILLFNGEAGKPKMTYLFYVFYPAHMLLLALLWTLTQV